MTRGPCWLAAAAVFCGALGAPVGRADDPAGGPLGFGRRLADSLSPGPLARAHQELEGITRCSACHTWLGETPDAPCLACHEEIGARREARLGFHGALEGGCAGCHPDHRGLEADLLGLDREAFAHDQALFRLRGAHTELACDDCHRQADAETGREAFHALLLPAGAGPAVCRDCHADPHGERLVRGRRCESCHVDAGWTVPVAADEAAGRGFDHDADTRFPLDALHAPLACTACHVPEAEAPPARECRSCHEDAVALLAGRFGGRRVAPDPHAATTECRGCHPAAMARASLPAYAAVCADCHPGSYASLLATRRALLDDALVRAQLVRGGAGQRRLLERLSRSGLHHPELAEALAEAFAAP